MLKKLRYHISIALYFMKISAKTILEYPANLVGWFLANPIQFVVGFATIKFVVERFDTLNGWTYEQLAFLYGIAVLSHGISVLFFVQTWFMGRRIIRGDFDMFKLRPLSVLFQFLFAKFNLVGFSDLISGLIVFGYGCSKIHCQWNIQSILLILVTVIGATLIRGAVYLACGSFSFWTKSVNSYVGFIQELFDRTTMYPISIYPSAIQVIFTYLIPLAWISFYPASEFCGKGTIIHLPFPLPWITLFAGIAAFGLACLVFCQGLNKYDSSGT